MLPEEPKPDPEAEAEAKAHAARVAANDRAVEAEMQRRTRRSFLAGGIAALGGFGAWEWIRTRHPDSGEPWPLRRVLDTNEEIARDYFSRRRLAREFPVSEAPKVLRINERIGMEMSSIPRIGS